MGRQDQDVSSPHLVGLSSDINRNEPLQDMNEGVERCSMLAQPLALVEGKDGHRPRFLLDNGPADD